MSWAAYQKPSSGFRKARNLPGPESGVGSSLSGGGEQDELLGLLGGGGMKTDEEEDLLLLLLEGSAWADFGFMVVSERVVPGGAGIGGCQVLCYPTCLSGSLLLVNANLGPGRVLWSRDGTGSQGSVPGSRVMTRRNPKDGIWERKEALPRGNLPRWSESEKLS